MVQKAKSYSIVEMMQQCSHIFFLTFILKNLEYIAKETKKSSSIAKRRLIINYIFIILYK